MADTLWQRAYNEGKKVEEKKSGIQAEVIWFLDELYLDDGSDYISPVTQYTEDDFMIVND